MYRSYCRFNGRQATQRQTHHCIILQSNNREKIQEGLPNPYPRYGAAVIGQGIDSSSASPRTYRTVPNSIILPPSLRSYPAENHSKLFLRSCMEPVPYCGLSPLLITI